MVAEFAVSGSGACGEWILAALPNTADLTLFRYLPGGLKESSWSLSKVVAVVVSGFLLLAGIGAGIWAIGEDVTIPFCKSPQKCA